MHITSVIENNQSSALKGNVDIIS